jgi:hypothetical protein
LLRFVAEAQVLGRADGRLAGGVIEFAATTIGGGFAAATPFRATATARAPWVNDPEIEHHLGAAKHDIVGAIDGFSRRQSSPITRVPLRRRKITQMITPRSDRGRHGVTKPMFRVCFRHAFTPRATPRLLQPSIASRAAIQAPNGKDDRLRSEIHLSCR